MIEVPEKYKPFSHIRSPVELKAALRAAETLPYAEEIAELEKEHKKHRDLIPDYLFDEEYFVSDTKAGLEWYNKELHAAMDYA